MTVIKLLKPRVLRNILRHSRLHKADHVRDLHKAGEAFEFVGHLEGGGVGVVADLGDADAVVVGREGVLVAGEDLFVEFLARAESAVFDLDVLVGLVAC